VCQRRSPCGLGFRVRSVECAVAENDPSRRHDALGNQPGARGGDNQIVLVEAKQMGKVQRSKALVDHCPEIGHLDIDKAIGEGPGGHLAERVDRIAQMFHHMETADQIKLLLIGDLLPSLDGNPVAVQRLRMLAIGFARLKPVRIMAERQHGGDEFTRPATKIQRPRLRRQ